VHHEPVQLLVHFRELSLGPIMVRLDQLAVRRDRFRQAQERRFKAVHLVKERVLRISHTFVFMLDAIQTNIGCRRHALSP